MTSPRTIPVDLYARESLVVRPRDLAARYARPGDELRRLKDRGVLRHLAHGYYLLPPVDRLTDDAWRPEVEAVALALAVADYGRQQSSLMGPSAARVHGALPRAIATAVVAVPRQRPALATAYGDLVFVERRVENLEVEPTRTALVTGFVTTVEQTMLDLADRPALGGLTEAQVSEAVRALALRADWEETLQLARRQRLHAAYQRARWVADTVLDKATPDWPSRRPVPGLGLRPPARGDAAFGIASTRPDDARS